jgi:hypothetical protein
VQYILHVNKINHNQNSATCYTTDEIIITFFSESGSPFQHQNQQKCEELFSDAIEVPANYKLREHQLVKHRILIQNKTGFYGTSNKLTLKFTELQGVN